MDDRSGLSEYDARQPAYNVVFCLLFSCCQSFNSKLASWT